MVFTKYIKIDPPREGKKVVFLMFLAPNTWFPHENNAISHSFFHGVSLFGLGLILGVFWVSREHLWEPRGTHWSLSWATLRTLGVLGVLLGASWDPSDVQLGDFVPSCKPCDANLGISWMTLPSLGSNLASFGYLVCEWRFLYYLWSPLPEFVHIGSAGLDLGWITFLMVEYFLFHS